MSVSARIRSSLRSGTVLTRQLLIASLHTSPSQHAQQMNCRSCTSLPCKKFLQRTQIHSGALYVSYKASIEVELKFVITPDSRSNLTQIGAQQVSTITFLDVYYDTADAYLMLNEHWLRCRDSQWQLKQTILDVDHRQIIKGAKKYNEFHGEDEIMPILQTALGDKLEKPSTFSFTELVRGRGSLLGPVAKFRTTRETWNLQERGVSVSIDLDQADFGHGLGEVEVVVQGADMLSDAEKMVAEISEKIGVKQDRPPESKLSSYFFIHNRPLWQKLIAREQV